MILRKNKVTLDEYLTELRNQISVSSIQAAESHLMTFLEFIGETPLSEASSIAKSYKAALSDGDLRKDGKTGPIAREYLRKNLGSVRAFLAWLRDEKDIPIKESWVKRNFSLTLSERNEANQRKPLNSPAMWFTPEEVVTLVHTPTVSLAEERIKASIVFLLMSGMRISAFLSLPIKAVNIQTRTVTQSSQLGVRTKAKKSGTTTILPFHEYPELMQWVVDWDTKVRSSLSPDAMWFANITPLTGELDPSENVGKNRDSGFRKDMKDFLQKAGLAYKSPHKLRHGHIRFLRDHLTSASDLEAIAKNCMQTVPTMLRYAQMDDDQTRYVLDRMCGVRAKVNGPAAIDMEHRRSEEEPDKETIDWVMSYLMDLREKRKN